VIIWTDVDGLMTADPRLVADARTIAEISYREAAEFARCGAKVLHPKTLGPVERQRIAVQIRHTFAPALPGTRIAPVTPAETSEVKGLAMNTAFDAGDAIISVIGRNLQSSDAERRILAALQRGAVKAQLRDSSDYSISLAVPRQDVTKAAAIAHCEFELGQPDRRNVSAGIEFSPSAWQPTQAQGTASAD
jgi:aspartokinase/homoserine dehydrogenase 1